MTTPDCTNDCVAPLRFPQRPLNRPGLPHLAYRIGTYADIRQALLRNLNKDPVLAGWTHQSPDDPGIALLEGAAVLGDILTFYQELYANEAYLSTARWREDVADLVRLLGYRLAPGLGGRGVFAFEVSGAAPVTIPKGFPVSAQVTGTGEAADFETSQELLAYPWLSRFSLFRPLWTPNITKATTELVVTGPDPFTDPVPLAKGDRLVLGRPYPAVDPARLLDGQVVVVDSVRELHGQQRFRIKGALSLSENAARLAGFKLGRSFRHVGNAAPPTMITVSNGTATQSPVGFGRSLNQTTSDNVDPDLDPKVFPLEGKIDGLAAGAPIVCQSALMGSVMLDFGVWPLPFPFRTPVVMTLIRTITEVRHGSYTWGPITGPATVAVVDRELTTEVLPAVDPWVPLRYTYDRVDIREIQFHETASPLLTIEAAPEPTPASAGHDLYFLGTDAQAQALNGRTLLLATQGQEPATATVQTVQTLAAGLAERHLLRRVTLDATVAYDDFPNDAPSVAVFGNLVAATQGKTQQEAVLGNGDARQPFQTFKLPKSPLTYLTVPGHTPPEAPELQVFVAGRRWTPVDTLFGASPKNEVYIVRQDAAGDSWVQFGDGTTGARLPSGVGNVTAVQRSGQGAYGPLVDGTKVQPGGQASRLDRLDLPGVISGGQQPEPTDNARRAAPGRVQALDRLVSLRDFETETLAIAGVWAAAAAWQLVDNVPTMVLTVLMQTGRAAEIDQVRQVLATANRCRGPQRFPVVVRQGSLRHIYLDLTAAIDQTFRTDTMAAAIKAALGATGEEGNGVDGSAGLFATGKRTFGQREYATRVEAVAQQVPGVRWASVNALGPLAGPPGPPMPPLPAGAWPLVPVVACGADQILALHTAHLHLSVSAAAAAECT